MRYLTDINKNKNTGAFFAQPYINTHKWTLYMYKMLIHAFSFNFSGVPLKFIRTGLLAVAILSTSFVNAGLITSSGDFSRNSDDNYFTGAGLIWLGWEVTVNSSVAQSVIDNPGYRFATRTEIDSLMVQFFGTVYGDLTDGLVEQSPVPFDVALFRTVTNNNYWTISRASIDINTEFGTFGVTRRDKLLRAFDPGWHRDGFHSTALVRDVPEPSTLAIFALGMIGLASRRFKKQS